MYVTPGGKTISTVVPRAARPGRHCRQILSQRAQRRLLNLRGLGIATSLVHGGDNGGSLVSGSFERGPHAPIRVFNPNTGTTTPATGTGTGITQTQNTAPAIPGSPVPQNYPTSQLYNDATNGSIWQFNSASGQWQQIGTVGVTSTYGNTPVTTSLVPGTPVPTGYPTNSPYVDQAGNVWTYSASVGTWVNSTLYAGQIAPGSTTSSAVSTSSLPAGYVVNPATGQAVLGTDIDPATGVSYAVEAANAAAAATDTSGTSALLSWFSQQTLITGVPNWVIAAGAGFLALKLTNRGR